ncbi:hypothetical protein [Herbidospora sp. RD11066]
MTGHVDVVYVEFPDREPFAWRRGKVLDDDGRAAVHQDFVDLVTGASKQGDTRLGRYVLSGSRLLVELPVTDNPTGRRLQATLVVTAPDKQPGWTRVAAAEAAALLSEGGLSVDRTIVDRLLVQGWTAGHPFALNGPLARGAVATLSLVVLFLLVRKLKG